MQTTNIPAEEQENVLGSFWTMLQECETHANNCDDRVLKHWVGQWYDQWNRVTGGDKNPIWDRLPNAKVSGASDDE